MTKDIKPKQSNAGKAVVNGPGNGSQPSKPSTELAGKSVQTMPALASLHEPDAPLLAAQLAATAGVPQGGDPAVAKFMENCNIAAYNRLRSRDGIESLLNRLLLAATNASMNSYSRAEHLKDPKAADLHLRNAMKGTAVVADLVKTIDSHRGQGQQSVTVGGVYVNSGGQAIVGNVGPKGAEQDNDAGASQRQSVAGGKKSDVD
jgi:hypothetical protein